MGNLRRNDATLIDLIVLAILIAVTSTLAFYSYGDRNQVSELPIVLRTMDSDYLPNDFYTNATQGFGPRSYFAKGISAVATAESLASVYLGITLLCNILIALITGLFARGLFGRSNLAGILAICAVMHLSTFGLGYTAHIYADQLVSSRLVEPFLLAAVWAGLSRRPIICAVAGGMGALIHPTFGLEVGAVSLLIAIVGRGSSRHGADPTGHGRARRAVVALVALMIFGAFATFVALPYLDAQRITEDAFIFLEAHLRHPHHNLPSTFGVRTYVTATGFFLATGVAWVWSYRKNEESRARLVNAAMLIGVLLALCVGGYCFVELAPSRLWVLARPFRLLFILKWLGLVLMAGNIPRVLAHGNHRGMTGFVLTASLVAPITLAIVHCSIFAREVAGKLRPVLDVYLGNGVLVLGMVGYHVAVGRQGSSIGGGLPFIVWVLSVLAFAGGVALWAARAGAIGAWILLATLAWSGWAGVPASGRATRLSGPPFTTRLSGPLGNVVDLGRWARENTPDDSVFLTPPDAGIFRLAARRALVVDFKAFPFQEQAMAEWRDRMFTCYGEPTSRGLAAATEMDSRYRNITDAKLRSLRGEFDITHALLYLETRTEFPILYSNQEYQLVRIATDDSAINPAQAPPRHELGSEDRPL